MSEWTPRNKYEVAPGLFIGSEIGDIDREVKILMNDWITNSNHESFLKIKKLHDRRRELLMPKSMRKNEN